MCTLSIRAGKRCGLWLAGMLLVLFVSAPVLAKTHPAWMQTAQREAQRRGYELVDHEQLAGLLDDENLLLIDVRPDYEFEAGHIPGSVNMEFDLGDRSGLSKEKRAAFKMLAGADKGRAIAIYCRSFR